MREGDVDGIQVLAEELQDGTEITIEVSRTWSFDDDGDRIEHVVVVIWQPGQGNSIDIPLHLWPQFCAEATAAIERLTGHGFEPDADSIYAPTA